MEIRVYAKDFAYLYSFDDFFELTIDRYHLGTGQLRVTVPRQSDSACYMQRGIWLQRQGSPEFYSVQQLEIGTENVTATAYSPHFFTGKYLIKPDLDSSGKPDVSQKERKITGSYDQAVKDWFTSSGINMTTATARPVAEGETKVVLTADCYGVLADAIEEVLSPRLMGTRYRFSESTGGFVFDTAEAVDKTMGNSAGNPPAVFSVAYDNLVDITYSESGKETITTVYAKDSSGTTPEVTVYGDSVTGYDRREAFVGLEENIEPQQQVDDTMKSADISFKAQVYPGETLVYGADFDIGDIVTAWVELPELVKTTDASGTYYDPGYSWKQVDQQIAQVTEHYQGPEFTLDVTFGKPDRTIPEQVKDLKKQRRRDGVRAVKK